MGETGRDPSDASTGRGTPGAPRTRRRQGPDSLSELPEETSPANTSLSDRGLLSCERIHSCCSQPPTLWSQEPRERNAPSLLPTLTTRCTTAQAGRRGDHRVFFQLLSTYCVNLPWAAAPPKALRTHRGENAHNSGSSRACPDAPGRRQGVRFTRPGSHARATGFPTRLLCFREQASPRVLDTLFPQAFRQCRGHTCRTEAVPDPNAAGRVRRDAGGAW